MSSGDVQEPVVNEEIEPTACPECGAAIVVYPPEFGLLPDEVDGERRATHHWRACELHRRLRALHALCTADVQPREEGL